MLGMKTQGVGGHIAIRPIRYIRPIGLTPSGKDLFVLLFGIFRVFTVAILNKISDKTG